MRELSLYELQEISGAAGDPTFPDYDRITYILNNLSNLEDILYKQSLARFSPSTSSSQPIGR